MTREEAIYYLKSSGMSDEQIKSVIDSFTCEDCISRKDVLKAVNSLTEICDSDIVEKITTLNNIDWIKMKINEIPSVTPQSKTGHWIETDEGFSPYECSECGSVEFKKSNYCPNCGAKMEVEE